MVCDYSLIYKDTQACSYLIHVIPLNIIVKYIYSQIYIYSRHVSSLKYNVRYIEPIHILFFLMYALQHLQTPSNRIRYLLHFSISVNVIYMVIVQLYCRGLVCKLDVLMSKQEQLYLKIDPNKFYWEAQKLLFST